MQNVILRESKKLIVSAVFIESYSAFKIGFLNYRKTWKTYIDKKSWQERDSLEEFIDYLFINKDKFPSEFDKKSPSEICQELKWKSVVITTSISEK